MILHFKICPKRNSCDSIRCAKVISSEKHNAYSIYVFVQLIYPCDKALNLLNTVYHYYYLRH